MDPESQLNSSPVAPALPPPRLALLYAPARQERSCLLCLKGQGVPIPPAPHGEIPGVLSLCHICTIYIYYI